MFGRSKRMNRTENLVCGNGINEDTTNVEKREEKTHTKIDCELCGGVISVCCGSLSLFSMLSMHIRSLCNRSYRSCRVAYLLQ